MLTFDEWVGGGRKRRGMKGEERWGTRAREHTGACIVGL